LESRSETLLIEEPWPGERVLGSGDEDDSIYPAHVMLADVAGQQSDAYWHRRVTVHHERRAQSTIQSSDPRLPVWAKTESVHALVQV
jgi:hypothetical protein